MTSSNIVPFGKYKGKPIEVMLTDRQYCEWLASQAWFPEKHQNIYNVIVNAGPEPQNTSEHNRLQAWFLDDAFCCAFAATCSGNDGHVFVERKFEVPLRGGRGSLIGYADVVLRTRYPVTKNKKQVEDNSSRYPKWVDCEPYTDLKSSVITIELKPSLGDDYPSIVRKAREKHCD